MMITPIRIPFLSLSLCVFILLLFPGPKAFAQSPSEWINKNYIKLSSNDTVANHEWAFLPRELKGKVVVGLGEASHGTHEFYVQKLHIIQYLVTKMNFKLLAIEFQDSLIMPANKYIQTGNGDLKLMMKNMALYNTEEIYNLFSWMRNYNQDKVDHDKIKLVGIDRSKYWSDPLTRDQSMAENLIQEYNQEKSKTIVWGHNVHIMKDTLSNALGAANLGSFLNRHFRDQFYTIGFDTYQGKVNVISNGEFEVHDFESLNANLTKLFSQSNTPSFFISFSKKHPFQHTENLITNIYSNWGKLKPLTVQPGSDFDAVVFIKNTTASKALRAQ